MEAQIYTDVRQTDQTHWWLLGRKRLLAALMENLRLPKEVKILDLGCGPGYLITALQKFGTVWGADTSPEAIRLCKERGLKNIRLIKDSRKLPFAAKTFQVVTCLDVLEHIQSDQKMIAEISRVLSPGGYVIIFVPAFPVLWSQMDAADHHYRRYTRKDLLAKLTAAGFVVAKKNYFNSFFFLPILITRLIQKLPPLNRLNWGVHLNNNHPLLNKLFYFAFSSDILMSFFVPVPFGVSIFVIAQKHA